MPQPSKIPLAFAASGDKNVIPESTETTGLASWRKGFPAITSAPFSEGGIAPKRADFNGIFNALSLATLWQQQGGFYEYDATTDYEIGNVVEYSGDLYQCLVANGPNSAIKAPTDTTVWGKISIIQTGTWTPVLKGGTTVGSFTYTSTNGDYVKFNNLCYVDFTMTATVVTVPTGKVIFSGFPFLPANAAQTIQLNLTPNPNAPFDRPPVCVRLQTTGDHELWGVNTAGNSLTSVGFSTLTIGQNVYFRASGIYRTT